MSDASPFTDAQQKFLLSLYKERTVTHAEPTICVVGVS